MVVILSADEIGDVVGRVRTGTVQKERLTAIAAVRYNERSMIGCEDGGRQRLGSCSEYGRRMQEDDCRRVVENFNRRNTYGEKRIGAGHVLLTTQMRK